MGSDPRISMIISKITSTALKRSSKKRNIFGRRKYFWSVSTSGSGRSMDGRSGTDTQFTTCS